MLKVKEKVSTKEIYLWNILGSICNALSSIVLLMFVTRFLGAVDGDAFSIAFAAGSLLSTIGGFQVRIFQSTDVTESYKFQHYFAFRILTSICMIFCSVSYIIIQGYSTPVIVMIMCLYKMIDLISDVFQGMFQQKERLDLAGKSIVIKSVMSALLFAVGIIVFRHLLTACVLLLAGEILFFFLYDINVYWWFLRTGKLVIQKEEKGFEWRRMKQLFYKCLPLFINAFLIMSIYQAPKNAIDQSIRDGILPAGAQQTYAVLFMPASSITLVLIFFRPMITEMAIFWNNQDRKAMYGKLKRIIMCLITAVLLIIFGGYLCGIPILSLLYGIDLSQYKILLLWMLIGGGLNSFASILDNVIVIVRKQKYLLAAYGTAWISAMIISPKMVEHRGIYGATLSYVMSMLILIIIILVISVKCLKRDTK